MPKQGPGSSQWLAGSTEDRDFSWCGAMADDWYGLVLTIQSVGYTACGVELVTCFESRLGDYKLKVMFTTHQWPIQVQKRSINICKHCILPMEKYRHTYFQHTRRTETQTCSTMNGPSLPQEVVGQFE